MYVWIAYNFTTFQLLCKIVFLLQDRKVIIKSMKTYVLKVCKEEYGHMVLLAMFDSVDDTKIVYKVILEVKYSLVLSY